MIVLIQDTCEKCRALLVRPIEKRLRGLVVDHLRKCPQCEEWFAYNRLLCIPSRVALKETK